MLAVACFIAFWVIVALGLVLLAGRAGRRPDPNRGVTRGATRSALILFAVTLAVFGIALPVLMGTANHSNANAQVNGIRLTAAQRSGRELFGQRCGVCHTLAAANAVGKVGPDLDLLRPNESLVLHTIENGCLPNPPSPQEACLSQGVMPANVVTGRQAEEVAAFVAKVTGGGLSSSGASSSPSAPSSTTTTSSSTPTTSSSTTAAPSGKAQTLTLAADPNGQLKFDKSSLTATAGKITIQFTNNSPLPHNVTIQQGTNGKVRGATPTFTKGTKSLTVTLPAGKYTYYCSVPGHRQGGMLGTLTVKPSSGSSSTAKSRSSTGSSASSSAPASAGKAQTIPLAAAPNGQLKFDKSSLTAKAGKITIQFTNDSPLPHNVTIQQGTNGKVLGATPTFTKGTKSLTLTLPAGKYTYYCSVPGHRQGGMLGTLTVT